MMAMSKWRKMGHNCWVMWVKNILEKCWCSKRFWNVSSLKIKKDQMKGMAIQKVLSHRNNEIARREYKASPGREWKNVRVITKHWAKVLRGLCLLMSTSWAWGSSKPYSLSHPPEPHQGSRKGKGSVVARKNYRLSSKPLDSQKW